MKRFLFIPSCALLTFGMLTSCQKEEKTAQQLAEELTAELQKVTDYKTAEAVAPRVEAINKRFQNASVRVFSADANALAGSEANAYADAVCRLVREMGRVQSSKPVTEADGEVDDTSLVRAVGVAAGAPAEAPVKDQFAKGQLYTYNADSESNNNPPAFAEYYGSSKLAEALAYVASTGDNGAFKFAAPEDVPAIPEAVEVEREEVPAMDVMPAEEEASAEEEPSADVEPAAEEEPVADEEPVDEAPAGELETGDIEVSADMEATDDSAASEDVSAEEEPVADGEAAADAEEPAADAEAGDEAAAADEEAGDEAAADEEAGDDAAAGEDDLGGDVELDIEL